jgi:hypothetical protein
MLALTPLKVFALLQQKLLAIPSVVLNATLAIKNVPAPKIPLQTVNVLLRTTTHSLLAQLKQLTLLNA